MRTLTPLLLLVVLAGCAGDDAPAEPLTDDGSHAGLHDPNDGRDAADAIDAGAPAPERDAGAPSRQDAGARTDAGADDPKCDLATPKSAPYLRYGLHPDASNALVSIGITSARILQTIGSAAAFAGIHAQDGTASGKPYSAATDLSVSGLSSTQIATLLDDLARVGYAGWYRRPGFDGWPASEIAHIHVIWVGAPMKRSLRDQIHDWVVGKNGLASHGPYAFHAFPKCRRDAILARFVLHNPATN